MKATCNKSKIMKLAHHYVKYDGYTMSQALKLAWVEAKRSEFYVIIETPKRVQREESIADIMSSMADSLISYYANNMYNGD